MQSLINIQAQVGQWSFRNFGDQSSKLDGTILGSRAPLRGIGEELGELADAVAANRRTDSEDAVGDILVYLCDWATREGFGLLLPETKDMEPLPHTDPLRGLMSAYGRLCHCTLKRDQGIRGMLHDEAYIGAVNVAVNHLLRYLRNYVQQYHPATNLLEILNNTWAKVVAKRNWVDSPEDGEGYAHGVPQPGDPHPDAVTDDGGPTTTDLGGIDATP